MNQNLIHLDKKHAKSCQDLDMVLALKILRFVQTFKIFAWVPSHNILAREPRMINHEMARYTKL